MKNFDGERGKRYSLVKGLIIGLNPKMMSTEIFVAFLNSIYFFQMRMRQYDSDEFVRDSVVYRGQNPPNYIQSAAKLWLACVYAIKQIYIPIRVQCNSHRGMRELNTIVMHSINDPVIGNTFLQAWRFGEE